MTWRAMDEIAGVTATFSDQTMPYQLTHALQKMTTETLAFKIQKTKKDHHQEEKNY